MPRVREITACETSTVRELDIQIIAELQSLDPNALVRFDDLNVEATGSSVWFYMQPAAKEALQRAILEHGQKLQVLSAYRTIAQQYLLFKQYQEKRCGIPLAARPSLSNHQSGLALDIEDPDGWLPYLERQGWKWLGNSDRAHFDYQGEGTLESNFLTKVNVQAFQKLWNRNNPSDPLAEDGDYGPETDLRLGNSPAEGFPKALSIRSQKLDRKLLKLTQPPMEGNDIQQLQEALIKAGIEVKKNGIFDSETELAVKKFQEQKGLAVDGIVGPSTHQELLLAEQVSNLQKVIESKQVLKLDELTANRELVREMQRRLTAIGLLQLSDIDGIFGPRTKEALIRFCNSQFLNNMNTGLFGPTFFQKLINLRTFSNPGFFPPNQVISLTSKLQFALQFTLKWEGGFVNHPNDLGGATNKGVTQTTYNAYRISKGQPTQSVELISGTEVGQIYSEMYWQPAQADLMVLPLAVVHFDTAVLFGVRGAILFLQEALGVNVDGVFGPQTQNSLQAQNSKETASKIIEGRIDFHRQRVVQNPSQRVFLEGWLNRANDLREFIQAL